MPFKITLLDVGRTMYGDCILCQFQDKTILIDGAHPGDWKSRPGFRSIPDQLGDLLGQSAPFEVDLLVVTHCHRDHIGCLPWMVAQNRLRVRWALVADEELGFGQPPASGPDAADDRPRGVRRVAAALREESLAATKNSAEIIELLDDAEHLEADYGEMLETLQAAGTKVCRYGRDNPAALLRAFRTVGLHILGPTKAHLQRCAEVIRNDAAATAGDVLADWKEADAGHAVDEVALYRQLAGDPAADAEDRVGGGAPINNQSLVIMLDHPDGKVLLSGDMQFAEPDVAGLDEEMAQLRAAVGGEAPFALAKIAHHGSHNALDAGVLQEMNGTKLLALSGGSHDARHPSGLVLELLRSQQASLRWARTDKNGQISFTFSRGRVGSVLSRGDMNDSSANVTDDEVVTPPEPPPREERPAINPPPPAPSPAAEAQEYVEVTTRVPHRRTRVTVTIDVDPAPDRDDAPRPPGPGPVPPLRHLSELRIAGGRKLPPLAVVVNRAGLGRNIGAAAAHVLAALQGAGLTVIEVPDGAEIDATLAAVHSRLNPLPPGILLLGGYDILPSRRIDVLTPELRVQLSRPIYDADQYIVWSDSAYGRPGGDQTEGLPVSRIPDGKSAELVFAAVQASGVEPTQRYGVRNFRRPFAQPIYDQLPGTAALLESTPITAGSLGQIATRGLLYFMLHGSYRDASVFSGEDNDGCIDAVRITNLPKTIQGVVFTGCCWGALTVEQIASRVQRGEPVQPRTADDSIALNCLRAGVTAFVGCTGSHYSPLKSPYNFFGGPMHQAFWRHLRANLPPAEALHRAKLDYLRGFPHGQTTPLGKAVETKTLRQFTCLGLGW